MPQKAERYRDLARKAVQKYLKETVGPVRPGISLLTEYVDATEVLEGQVAFAADIANGTKLVVIVDPGNNEVKITDINAGDETTRIYPYYNVLGILCI